MGLAEWFNGFCDNLQVKDGGTISTRYPFRVGSGKWRNTSIRIGGALPVAGARPRR